MIKAQNENYSDKDSKISAIKDVKPLEEKVIPEVIPLAQKKTPRLSPRGNFIIYLQ